MSRRIIDNQTSVEDDPIVFLVPEVVLKPGATPSPPLRVDSYVVSQWRKLEQDLKDYYNVKFYELKNYYKKGAVQAPQGAVLINILRWTTIDLADNFP